MKDRQTEARLGIAVLALVGQMGVARVVSAQQTPEPPATPTTQVTPTPNPYDTRIERQLSAPETDQPIILENVNVSHVIQVGLGVFGKLTYGVVSAEDGKILAILSNVDDCMVDPLGEEAFGEPQEYTIETRFTDIKATSWEVDAPRFTSLEVTPDKVGWEFNVENQNDPVILYTALSVTTSSGKTDCPTRFGQITGSLRGIDAGQLSQGLGEIIGEITSGLQAGFNQGRNN